MSEHGATQELTGFRRRLHSGDLLVGALLSIPDPAVATILGRSGFDFVIADAEHGPFDLTSLRACVEALEPTPAATLVRAAANDPVLIKQTLELGIDGIQLPSVSSAAEAEAAVRAARFAPEGARGVGLGRASGYGADLSSFVIEANARTAVLVMIETGAGVENAAEIAAVPGLDGIVIGQFDLSADLGAIGDTAAPAVVEAVGLVVERALAAGVEVGTACSAAEAPALAARGLRVLTVFADVLALAAAARNSVELARSAS
jgi:2-dehydro-3-deoxyglucarate aldolase/4-hydroxy-2-oxoheptanedioate aldolase